MNDISVSRSHATLKLTQQGLFLEDNNSKFGTLVLVREGFPILKNRNNVHLQVGRTLVQMTVKANWKYVMKHSKYVEQSGNEYNTKNYFLRQNNIVDPAKQTEEDNIIEIADSEEDEDDEEEDEDPQREDENHEDRQDQRDGDSHLSPVDDRERSDSLLPRELSNPPIGNQEPARVEHSSSNRLDSPNLQPVAVQVQSRNHGVENSASLVQPQEQADQGSTGQRLQANAPQNDLAYGDATMMESRVSDTFNRAATSPNQGQASIRNQSTNIGNLEVAPANIQPTDSVDLFVIQDNPIQVQESNTDNLQLSRFEQTMNPQSPTTQLVESSPERLESPETERLQPPHGDLADRRNRPLGAINSIISEESKDKEISLNSADKGRDDI